jgi:hypothetical protein
MSKISQRRKRGTYGRLDIASVLDLGLATEAASFGHFGLFGTGPVLDKKVKGFTSDSIG